MLPKTSTYVNSYDGKTKWMYFLTENDDIIIENIILFVIKSVLILKKTTDSEPIYNKKFLKNKIQSHDDDVTNFYNK